MAFVYERPIHFDEVDPARVVFFARFLHYCHEAMEAFFAPLEGGYAGLVIDRDVGFPSAHLDVTYHAPLRYGDSVRIHLAVEHVGRSSARFRHELRRINDGVLAATIRQTVVCCSLSTMRPLAHPEDVLRRLQAYLEPTP